MDFPHMEHAAGHKAGFLDYSAGIDVWTSSDFATPTVVCIDCQRRFLIRHSVTTLHSSLKSRFDHSLALLADNGLCTETKGFDL